MKKDLIFAPILLVLGIVLFLFKQTGLTAHIVISAIGVALLIAYTVLTKKQWKIIPLEIVMRASYGIALITGIIVMNAGDSVVLEIVHKVFAGAFVIVLAALTEAKLIGKK